MARAFCIPMLVYLQANRFVLFQDRLNRFIPEMYELLENCVSVEKDREGKLIIILPEAKYILVNQDEKIHHSNDVQRRSLIIG